MSLLTPIAPQHESRHPAMNDDATRAPADDDFVTVAEAAAILKVHRYTITKLITSQRLRAEPIGRGTRRMHYRIRRRDLYNMATPPPLPLPPPPPPAYRGRRLSRRYRPKIKLAVAAE
jgi:excisionase family DNA binding protein